MTSNHGAEHRRLARKAKLGRPELPAHLKRVHKLTLALSAAEFAQVYARARDRGVKSPAVFARREALGSE